MKTKSPFHGRDIRITGLSRHHGVWMYHIQLNDSEQARRYTVLRRFNEFRQLHCKLYRLEPRLPKLPPDGFWTVMKSNDTGFLAARTEKLEQILRYADANARVRQNASLIYFLRPPFRESTATRGSGYESFTTSDSPDIKIDCRVTNRSKKRCHKTKTATYELSRLLNLSRRTSL